MDLHSGLERTLHGQVKISLCIPDQLNCGADLLTRHSDNAMLYSPSVRRKGRARRLVSDRQSQKLRAAALRSPA